MAYLTLQKGSSANLNNVAVKDGQILVTTDTRQIYLDNGLNRLLLNDYPVISVNNKVGAVSLNYSDVGAAPSSHNHTSLTGVTNISFAAHENDTAKFMVVVDGTNTYFDSFLADDASQNDTWRWRFSPSGGTEFSAMELDATEQGVVTLKVPGTITATTFNGNATSATTASKWTTARTLTLNGDVSGSVSLDGKFKCNFNYNSS